MLKVKKTSANIIFAKGQVRSGYNFAKLQIVSLNSPKHLLMKKSLLLVLSLFPLLFLSQINRAYYQFTYKPNKTDTLKEKILQVLIFSSEKSTFQSYRNLQRDSLFAISLANKNKSGEFLNNDENFSTSMRNQYVISTDLREKNIVFKEILADQYLSSYEEKIDFDWRVTKEKELINNILCQKALTEYGGRSWSAWFSTEYNFNFGPYKFFGLPGLIIKLYDSEENFVWELNGLKKQTNEDYYEKTYFELQDFRIKTFSKQKFLQLQKSYDEYPMGNINEIFPGASDEELKRLREIEKQKVAKNKYYNNPIEL